MMEQPAWTASQSAATKQEQATFDWLRALEAFAGARHVWTNALLKPPRPAGE